MAYYSQYGAWNYSMLGAFCPSVVAWRSFDASVASREIPNLKKCNNHVFAIFSIWTFLRELRGWASYSSAPALLIAGETVGAFAVGRRGEEVSLARFFFVMNRSDHVRGLQRKDVHLELIIVYFVVYCLYYVVNFDVFRYRRYDFDMYSFFSSRGQGFLGSFRFKGGGFNSLCFRG